MLTLLLGLSRRARRDAVAELVHVRLQAAAERALGLFDLGGGGVAGMLAEAASSLVWANPEVFEPVAFSKPRLRFCSMSSSAFGCQLAAAFSFWVIDAEPVAFDVIV